MAETPPVVLIVDDEDASRFAKVHTLRRAGFDVHEASNGQMGLDLANRIKPDIFILDVNLPDISGLEIARRLRASPGGAPILQVSNTAITAADQVRGLEHGADVYLTEPVDATVLIATVRALLRARRAESALAGALEREQQARGIAEDASRLKDDFIATLSHELRTPLNALMGWIYQLRHSTLDERGRERALDSIERNARVQAKLIDDLLDISRISKGKLRLRMELVDLSVVVDDVAETIGGAALKKHLTLTVKAAAPCVVVADRSRIQQVVTNLLSNAVQYTPENGSIGVSLAVEDQLAVLTVRDTGSGIDPEFLPHVFDPFRQGESGARRSHGGLGLGLSVVRQLVELHGGSVSVSSAGLGSGSLFTVTLPIEDASLAALRGSQPVTADGEPAPVLSGVHALVVHEDAAEIAAILEASGAQAEEGAAADIAERLASARFDVVVTGPAGSADPAVAVPSVAALASAPGQLVRDVVRAMRPRSR